MAITKIHAIKATVYKAVNYICDPHKTGDSILISSYGCSPQTAHYDFKFALSKTRQSDENKAFHLIQSFAPGEVTFDEAHTIGTELADRILEGKYSYVLSTHIDRDHIHNHIIFCAADNIDHKKYNDCKRTYWNIRRTSDMLCKEHNLSVIAPGQERGKSYAEWSAQKSNTSWKTQIRRDINEAIRFARSYEEFLELMRAKGYDIKGELLTGDSLKTIALRLPGQERFIRGSIRSLGPDFTRERINERIQERLNNLHKPQTKDYAAQRLIDTSIPKFQDSPGLKNWADIENLKIVASTYSNINSITELEQKIASKTAIASESKRAAIDLEHKQKALGEIIKYAEQYSVNRPYHLQYRKSKNPDEYLQKHESNLILYDGAKQILTRSNIDLKSLNLKKLQAEYNSISAKKKELLSSSKTASSDAAQMQKELDKLNEYLGNNEYKSEPDLTHKNKHHSTPSLS